MKQLFYTVAVTLILLTMGVVAVSYVQSKTAVIAEQENAMPSALPTALVGFPDIEHVPVYPGATVTFTKTETTKLNHMAYQVEEPMEKVIEFYQEMLPKKGWLLRSRDNHLNVYNWTDLEGKLFWQMYLEFEIELSLDTSKTVVYLNYGRYPNTEEGLPLYPGAQQISVSHSIMEKSFPSGKTPVRVTDITYLSSANPLEIAAFYNNSMQDYGWLNQGSRWSTQEHGWFPFDNPGAWEGYNPHEGLYFVAWRPSWGETSGVYSYNLLATATQQKDGRVVIKLHVEEMESSLGDF